MMAHPNETVPPRKSTVQVMNVSNRSTTGTCPAHSAIRRWRTNYTGTLARGRCAWHGKACDKTRTFDNGSDVCSSWCRRRSKTGRAHAAFVALFLLSFMGRFQVGSGSCQDGGRTVLTSPTGFLSDGTGSYPENTECQWLIQASNSSQSICIEFNSFETECTYDFLHIFDGDSFNSPRMGSFSGNKIPPNTCSTSGKMLIYLYSDTNYPLDGFELIYTISDCPWNCSGRGSCVDYRCQCMSGFHGDACQYMACPNECGTHGTCDHDLPQSRCLCQPGYIGESCSLSTNTNDGWGNIFRLSSGGGGGFLPRAGHAAVYYAESDAMYVFGGYDLVTVLGGLVRYDFRTNTWQGITASGGPAGRYAHTMDLVGGDLIIVGGTLADGAFTDEVWSFDVNLQRWDQLPSLPTLSAHHSSCVVDGTVLYVIGGRSNDSSFHHLVHRLNVSSSQSGWEVVASAGGLPDSIGVAEHSSVYYPPTRSIYVFGGIRQQNIKFGVRSNDTYTFNVDKRIWLKLSVLGELPRGRTYHTAGLVGQNYMVVYGGNTHAHRPSGRDHLAGYEDCYEKSIHLYHFGCNAWVDFNIIAPDFTPDRAKSLDGGRFGHAAVVRDGTTLVIAGGFRGLVTSEVLAIKMPGTVAVNPATLLANVTEDVCSYHRSATACMQDLQCGYCPSTSTCVNKDYGQECAADVEYGDCPGFCSQATTCQACLSVDGSTSERCGWCVQTGTCHPATDIEFECSSVTGWWGNTSTILGDFFQCALKDFPPGLTLVKHYRPDRKAYPDEVTVIQHLDQELNPQSRPKVVENRWTLTGYLYPLGAIPSKQAGKLKVFIKSTNSDTKLWIGADDSPASADLVATFDTSNGDRFVEALRPDGTPLIPDPASRYYIRLEATVGGENKPSILELSWNGNAVDVETIPPRYLRPFYSTNCSIYQNCLSCLKDAFCGWCPLSETCEQRDDAALPRSLCGTAGTAPVVHHLTLNQEYCPNCRSYLDCTTCAQSPHCEWYEDTKFKLCAWRGPFPDTAVQDPDNCSASCYQRATCGACVQQDGCAWCGSDQRCFPFKHYVKTYSYGQCSHWFDKDNPCPNCSAHENCYQCLEEFQCGWCGNSDIPLYGACTAGDFHGPFGNQTCSSLVSKASQGISPTEPSVWSYKECIEVDECAKGLAVCHPNATCHDLEQGYECTCNRGFKSDGDTSCERTCLHDCVNGVCSEYPDYECRCDLGWTGSNCTIDCGCNMHSTCTWEVGMCDQCMMRTTGEHCDQCEPGSFGNPLAGEGCHPCNCNGNGDPSRGYCNASSQKCHCINNTAGDHCEKCAEHFYGDPQREGCFLKCSGRTIVWGESRVALGSLQGEGIATDPPRASCLWILSSFESEESAVNSSIGGGLIQFTITSVNSTCGRDYVQVYDGIPASVWQLANSTSRLLGSYCGHGNMEPLTVTAHSGFVTVIFQAVLQGQYRWTGFTALFEAFSCGEDGRCGPNRTCIDGGCSCDSSHRGARCDQDTCPGNCHETDGHGMCNQETGVCNCSSSYGGGSCSHVTSDVHRGVWTPLDGGIAPPGRVGHSMFTRADNRLVVFGGYSDEAELLGDMWSYNPTDSSWSEVVYANAGPSPRYFHGSVYLPALQEFVLYGGLTETGVSSEMWIFNTSTSLWYQKEFHQIDSAKRLPPLAGLSLTAFHPSRLLLVGGYSPQEAFYPEIKEYNAVLGQWSRRVPKGIAPIGIYGHVAVWHEASRALYLFGGYRFARGRVWASDVLYSYVPSSNIWNVLPPASNFAPSSHLFHTGFTTLRYLFILGGGTSEQNFTSSVYAYHYDCNIWQEVVTTNDGPLHAFGQTAVRLGSVSYMFGGFVGRSVGSLHSLVLPEDLCSQYQSQQACKRVPSCTSCMVNHTFQSCSYTDSCSPYSPGHMSVSDTLSNGSMVECNTTVVSAKTCREHKTCGECLATYPAQTSVKTGCKWCFGCPEVMCIPKTDSCEDFCVNNQYEQITDINSCSELTCPVSDCEECLTMQGCMWTRQFEPVAENEIKYRLALVPSYSWNCYSNKLLAVSPVGTEIETAPPLACPAHCDNHTTCTTCLDSDGADGGWSSCVWSTQLQQCLSPSFLYLMCTTGRCGLIVYNDSELCPVPCDIITRCDGCLRQPSCGWCSVGTNYTDGVCMGGTNNGPAHGICQDRIITAKMSISGDIAQLASERAEWFYMTCPPENECINGEHNCGENEQCVDTLESYDCLCKDGYREDSNGCVPICSRECLHGRCVAPDTCKCDFGYVGEDCTQHCRCNNHSSCAGPDDLANCTSCVGNTTGLQCESCTTFHVGNATEGGQCVPCRDVCHGNTDICVSGQEYTKGITAWEGRPGPLPDDVICLNCSNNSAGARCEQCENGYFMLKGRCHPCQCNGHSDTCNKVTGIGCHCSNHTRSPPCPEGSRIAPCYQYQCSVCTEPDVFKGTPTNGHQCYRQVEVTAMRCFGESTKMQCSSGSPLRPGRSEFFVVKPTFVDLDIRVTVDISEGSVDVFASHEPDTFVVTSHGGSHTVLIDGNKDVDRTDLVPIDGSRGRRGRRDLAESDDDTNIVTSIHASGLSTFVTVENSQFVVVVRNVQNRLVVTFPHGVHNFEKKWFYLVVQATGGGWGSRNDTPGALVYRQDIPEIDLFIFFSAFLSSFFMLLAVLIAAWKVKVGWEARQAERARTVEMESRRSRPFGRAVVYMEGVADPLPAALPLPAHPSRRTKRRGAKNRREGRGRATTPSAATPVEEIAPPPPAGSQPDTPPEAQEPEKVPFMPAPIALEPTEDGLAAIGTVMIHLPGGREAPIRACLGSGLVRQGRGAAPVPPNQTRMARHGGTKQSRQSSGRTYQPV